MKHLNKTDITSLKKDLLSYQIKRRVVINESNNALHHAKRAIFAMHRDNVEEAKLKLAEVEKIIKGLNTKYKNDKRIRGEGAYRAALEEYVEAGLFYKFLTGKKIEFIKKIPIESDVFIAGLCDVPGEMLRYAIKSATERDIATVKKCAEGAQEIIGELIEFNLTSYLRNKFDQAKNAVNKIEQVVYEVSLRE